MTNTTPYEPTPHWKQPERPDTDFGYSEIIYAELNFQAQIWCFINREDLGMALVKRHLALNIGDNKTYLCYVKDRYNNPINIADCVCTMTFYDEVGGIIVIQKHTNVSGEGVIGSPDEGEFYFYLVPSDTSALDAQQYPFKIEIDFPSGKHYTISQGVLQLNSTPNV